MKSPFLNIVCLLSIAVFSAAPLHAQANATKDTVATTDKVLFNFPDPADIRSREVEDDVIMGACQWGLQCQWGSHQLTFFESAS